MYIDMLCRISQVKVDLSLAVTEGILFININQKSFIPLTSLCTFINILS